jgi:hypothetical protein
LYKFVEGSDSMTDHPDRLRALAMAIDDICFAIVNRRPNAPPIPIRYRLKPIRDQLRAIANEIAAEERGVTVDELFGRVSKR